MGTWAAMTAEMVTSATKATMRVIAFIVFMN
jgi:hypothetical protein